VRSVPRVVAAGERDQEAYVAFGNMETRNGLQERIEIPLLIHALSLPKGQRILEVGCGRGIALPVLASRLAPRALVGIDVDQELVAIAQQRLRVLGVDASVHHADVRALPFDDASFDLVIDFGTCYHVSGGRAGARAALSEIARVLVPGGSFVHETLVAQHLAHPLRSFGRTLPWSRAGFSRRRSAVLWTMRQKV
jgi:ubiquinone/menaquinone biosynthesis C-methylase UbiE